MTAGAGKGPVIAIDGPSGVGKTTVSRLVAKRLGFKYIDTGAMYRAFAVAAKEAEVDVEDEDALERFASTATVAISDAGGIFVNNVDYTGKIRTEAAGAVASVVSAKKKVREFLVGLQRSLGEQGRVGPLQGVVMEGRDIGTAVFPDADIKFFLDASHEVRAQRRGLELQAKGAAKDACPRVLKAEVSNDMKERDRRDRERKNSPLVKADDAILIDTGALGIEGVVEKIIGLIRQRNIIADICS